jgi:hypothetical protein
MSKCIINNWVGRFGNNILQIVRCIYYAQLNNYELISFQNHDLLIKNEIKVQIKSENNIENQNIIENDFFNLSIFNVKDPEPYIMKNIALKYIKPLLKINFKEHIEENNLYIHIRGGDIFLENPHPAYIQPPLNYYLKIINNNNYNKINIVHEDDLNPCINYLKKNNEYNFYSQTLEKDLELLLNAKNLIFGFGTFGFVVYLLNSNIKKIFFPKYVIDELPIGNWGNDIDLIIINIPNYIRVGEWKNTEEQIKLMIDYNL